MKATCRSNQYCVYDNTVKWHTKRVYIFNNPNLQQQIEQWEKTHVRHPATHLPHVLPRLGKEKRCKREAVGMKMGRNILNSLLRCHICRELFSKLSFPFSPQPISDWHLNKASSILERTDICIAIFFLLLLCIFGLINIPRWTQQRPFLPVVIQWKTDL